MMHLRLWISSLEWTRAAYTILYTQLHFSSTNFELNGADMCIISYPIYAFLIADQIV